MRESHGYSTVQLSPDPGTMNSTRARTHHPWPRAGPGGARAQRGPRPGHTKGSRPNRPRPGQGGEAGPPRDPGRASVGDAGAQGATTAWRPRGRASLRCSERWTRSQAVRTAPSHPGYASGWALGGPGPAWGTWSRGMQVRDSGLLGSSTVLCCLPIKTHLIFRRVSRERT